MPVPVPVPVGVGVSVLLTQGILGDALHILASKEIKLSAVQRYNKALAGEEIADDEELQVAGKDAAVRVAAKVLHHLFSVSVWLWLPC